MPNFRNISSVVKWVKNWGGKSYFYGVSGFEPEYSDSQKLGRILKNPAALFIILLVCDLCSRGRFRLYRSEEDREARTNEIEDHPLLDLLRKPNPMQTQEQFLWDYMFWRMLGCSNLYTDNPLLTSDNNLYFLSPDMIDWPQWFASNQHTLFITSEDIEELMTKELHYVTNTQKITFEYRQLKQFYDLSNGVKGWFTTPSRIEALYKIIQNSENLLDSKNVNSHLARKFMVSGKTNPDNVTELPMSEGEKKDIERKVLSFKNIHAVKTMVDIKRFIDDLGGLQKLDQSFMNDAFLIGKMYHIPRDVIERFDEGSTYENQEKARASVISYAVDPGAEDLCTGLLDLYGVEGVYLALDYSHLPFVQAFEKDKAETADSKSKAFKNMVQAGADPQEAATASGLDLTTFQDPYFTGGKDNRDGDDPDNQEN